MSYCGPRGLPLSEFLAWDQADQDAALAWQTYEARRCTGCGTHPDEGPKHFHVNVCPTCVQLDKVGKSEDAQATGAHLTSSPGTQGTCSRCLGVIQANASGGDHR